jgi:hypothetical protein
VSGPRRSLRPVIMFLRLIGGPYDEGCTRRVIVSKSPDYNQHVDSEIETKALGKTTKDNVSWKIIYYANQMSRTIAPVTGISRAGPPLVPTSSPPMRRRMRISLARCPWSLSPVSKTPFAPIFARLSRSAIIRVSPSRYVLKTTSSLLARRLPLSTVGASSRKDLSSVLLTHKSAPRSFLVSRSWRGLPLKTRRS